MTSRSLQASISLSPFTLYSLDFKTVCVSNYDMAFPAAVSTDTYLSEPTSKMSVT